MLKCVKELNTGSEGAGGKRSYSSKEDGREGEHGGHEEERSKDKIVNINTGATLKSWFSINGTSRFLCCRQLKMKTQKTNMNRPIYDSKVISIEAFLTGMNTSRHHVPMETGTITI